MMKKLLLSSLVLTLVTLCTVMLTCRTPETHADEQTQKPTALDSDKNRTITVLDGDSSVKMTVYDYLVGVVAAEMPVSFEDEALKAQAVAARSYLERALDNPKHENADICTDFDCCQAYIGLSELRKKWGDSYDAYIIKIKNAVEATDGQYLSYEGKAALTAFHSSSDGTTESSGEVWSDVPYLVSVSTPETADTVPNYISTLTLADIDFRDTVLYLKPEADMTGDADEWIGKITRSDSGRVRSIIIGGVKLSGTELRELFTLRSTAFEISHADGKFTFTVTGYGHGVGMSQYGANEMAKNGSDYREILSHYYPGTELT